MIKDRNKNILVITYNHLNLPKKITIGGAKPGTITYIYSANGEKLKKTVAEGSKNRNTEYIDTSTPLSTGGFQYKEGRLSFFPTTEGYVNVTYQFSSSGPLLTFYNYVYNYTDHLGNIRLRYTKDPEAETGLKILEEDHYYPFGLKHKGYNNEHNIFYPPIKTPYKVVIVPITPDLRDPYKFKYNGKEFQDELGLDWYDYGARNYDASLGRWMNVDPLAEEFPWQSPYSAFNNNPIRFVDPDGRAAVDHIDVTKNKDGTYNVEGGQANSDKSIYVVDADGNRTGEVLGEMLTEYSFHNEDGSAVVDANIDLNDQSGQNFFNNEIINVGLFEYMGNATGGKPLDFKTNDMPDGLTRAEQGRYTYRGMTFKGKITSARDVGNYSAGYVAGKHGFGWGSSRFAFDALETQQSEGTFNTIMFYPFNRVREGQPTQRAQQAGHNVGYPIFKQRQFERQFQRATNPLPIGPKY